MKKLFSEMLKATHRSVSPVGSVLVNAVKKLRNKAGQDPAEVPGARQKPSSENKVPVNSLRSAADSLSAMQKWYMNDFAEDEFSPKRSPKRPPLKSAFEEPVVLTFPKSPVKRIPKSENTKQPVLKQTPSLSQLKSERVVINTTSRTLSLSNSAFSDIQAAKSGELKELQAANNDMLGILAKQEQANDKLRTELREARSELNKWRKAFSTLPADRFDRYTQRLHDNSPANEHW